MVNLIDASAMIKRVESDESLSDWSKALIKGFIETQDTVESVSYKQYKELEDVIEAKRLTTEESKFVEKLVYVVEPLMENFVLKDKESYDEYEKHMLYDIHRKLII